MLFVLVSFFAKEYENELKMFVAHGGIFNMALYTGVSAIAVIISPISTFPLLPIASMAWGWIIAGTLSIIGWTIGAQIAFFIARYMGKHFIQQIISIEKLSSFEKHIPKNNLFWTVVFLRIIIPVDVLSYALGLFSSMKPWPYFWSTFIGITPLAFIFAYLGESIHIFDSTSIAFTIGGIILLIYAGYTYKKRYSTNK